MLVKKSQKSHNEIDQSQMLFEDYEPIQRFTFLNSTRNYVETCAVCFAIIVVGISRVLCVE